jgi:hypothetical protein
MDHGPRGYSHSGLDTIGVPCRSHDDEQSSGVRRAPHRAAGGSTPRLDPASGRRRQPTHLEPNARLQAASKHTTHAALRRRTQVRGLDRSDAVGPPPSCLQPHGRRSGEPRDGHTRIRDLGATTSGTTSHRSRPALTRHPLANPAPRRIN